ncbi:PTS mannitol transporter subunit IICBA [Sporolactobacillus terrae]|uniref:Mannitol-specific phosphotransferase enzyme IIA component n=1 Tax=Sporolactobacillus terrae TaxID=269673 RepID=A0ABX5Q5C3_9BACL|nr:PTS mannitol transporter subunit IICBA [Sporolactobacillus terrae]QAA21845.1 PTS mannitol transporter subunit IICBA [Sporolactobacillus terrae]QAA24818.1 PTS mannitol transporter subunit IICBA [Sporolactobacillus terrae]
MSAGSGVKVKVQKFGNFLSSMILPNIGAFIAWGLITALFIPTGWLPNKALAELVDPTVTYLLPILIGYSGGKLVFDHRGGVVGAIATAGVIIGTDIPMFLGAMIMGPLGGYVIKKFDKMVEGKIKTGFEMLVDNFSAGILGALLAILAFLGVGPVVDAVSAALASGVEWLVGEGLLPLASLFIEPGKVLFLNNAINHGVLTPIAVEQARQYGSSVLFLLEANPGPGLGILLAYSFFGKGNAKKSAPGAAIIHFFGGIHEIYFPYILMKPLLFVATIAAGMSGIFTLVTLKGGLVGPASPGSFIAMLAVTPKSFGSFAANIAAVCVATIVSFAIGSLILKTDKAGNENLEEATRKMESMKGKKSRVSGVLTDSKTLDPQAVKKIVFACDAGMGSSAMGASLLRKKVKAAGLAINVTNTAVSSIPSDAQIVVTQSELTPRAKEKAPDAYHVSVDNFLSSPSYDLLINQLSKGEKAEPEAAEESSVAPFVDGDILRKENVFINQSFKSKEEVIRFAGQKLVEGGYVKPSYVEGMIARDRLMSTYMGNGIAIPHGTEEVKKEVLASGIVIIQIPDSVDFDGNKVRLVFGIAGKNNSHLEILSKIAVACSDVINVGEMVRAQSVDELITVINHAVAQNA